MKKSILLFISIFFISSLYAQNLYINEFMASNDTSYYDETTQNYPDWIEIYNAGSESVDIGGMYITDDLSDLTAWQIPTTAPDTTTIPAGGFLLLLADKKTEAGVLHVNLKLKGSGEQIGLTMSDGTTIIDSLTFGEQTTDISYGRNPDGGNAWNYFIAGTPGYSNGEGTVVGIHNDELLPDKFALYQNYPNPFNPSTTIKFSIPANLHVKLSVYDMLGREIQTLVNSVMPAGVYKRVWGAQNLTSGVYFYRISAGNFIEIKKMILMK